MLGKMHNNKCTIFHPFIFPKGKVVHQSLNIMNSFSQKVKIQHIRSLSEDVRFYYKRLRSNKEELESGKKSKVCFCLLLQVVVFFLFVCCLYKHGHQKSSFFSHRVYCAISYLVCSYCFADCKYLF